MMKQQLWSDDADEAFDAWHEEMFGCCSDAASKETIAYMRDLLQSVWRAAAMWCVKNPPPECLTEED